MKYPSRFFTPTGMNKSETTNFIPRNNGAGCAFPEGSGQAVAIFKQMKKQNRLILLFMLLGILNVQAQIKLDDHKEEILSWLNEFNVPAVGIGIIEDGKVNYVKVFGELKKGVPAPDITIFSIASMTKPVTAMLTLKLVEAGQRDLDEPLFHYWIDPDVANDALLKKLTSRFVLSHQTGFQQKFITN